MRVIAFVAAALMLSGCMSVTALGDTFEGGADFTIVPVNSSPLADAAITHGPTRQSCQGRTCFDLGSLDRFPVVEGSSDAPHFFKEKDNIHISLKTGTVSWFSEGAEQHAMNRVVELFGARSPVKGEVAIIANVTEGKRNPGGIMSDGELEGRVVFYSNDIYRRQRLNDFYVPIHGPAPYGGGPLTIDLWVMELDRAESDQMGAVLSTLADLSKSAPSLAFPGFALLSRVGTAFLKANQDDVIGHIGLTLLPPKRATKLGDPVLQVSDIIVRRAEDRDADLHFGKCVYVAEQGAVHCETPGRKDNYLVLSLRKSDSTASITPDEVSLANFNKRLAAAPGPTAMSAALNEFADETISDAKGRVAISLAEKAIDPANDPSLRQLDAEKLFESLQCHAIVASSAPTETMDSLCGDRAKDRQMSADDFENAIRRLVGAQCVDPGGINSKTLVGDSPTSESLATQRATLAAAVVAKCPSSGSARPTT